MRIFAIHNVRMPTEKAHGYQIAKTCEALARRGCAVTLVVPDKQNPIKQDLFDYYGVERNFSLQGVSMIDFHHYQKLLGRFTFFLQHAVFLLKLSKFQFKVGDVIFTREPEIAWFFSRRGVRVVFEAHRFPKHWSRVLLWLLKHIDCVVANSQGTAQVFLAKGFQNVIVASNGVDLNEFKPIESRLESRRRLELSEKQNIILYSGHLYDWKGARVLLEAARILNKEYSDPNIEGGDCIFVFIGGTKEHVATFKALAHELSTVLILGHVSHMVVPYYLNAADVLVLPNTQATEESVSYTSPIKMFEYMASGVPIVASDLPSIREVLNPSNAVLVKPDDPKELAAGIQNVLQRLEESKILAQRARADVEAYSWEKRAEKIVHFLEHLWKA